MATDTRSRVDGALPDGAAGPGAAPEGTERTLGQLVAAATQDMQTIVRAEIDLAKAELSASAKTAGMGAAMFAAAAVVSLYGIGFLLAALAWGLAQLGLMAWAAFLIVAVLLLAVAGALALLGKKALAKMQPKPERTIANAEATIATIKQQR